MTERNVIRCIVGILVLCVSVIVGAYVLLRNSRKDKPAFVEPAAYCIVPGVSLPDNMPLFLHCRNIPRQQDI